MSHNAASRSQAVVRLGRERPGLVAILVLAGAIPFLRPHVPGPVIGIGIASGAVMALQAMAVVLIYRTTGIINFAQVQLGVVTATLFVLLSREELILRVARSACPTCLDKVSPGLRSLEYWSALVVSLVFAALVSIGLYLLVVKRFANAPRLVLTVATVFVAQILAGLKGGLAGVLAAPSERATVALRTAPPPLDWTVHWGTFPFHARDILAVAVAGLALAGITAYYRLTDAGLAGRVAGQNPVRAETMGVNVKAVGARIWAVAGLLAGVAGVLSVMAYPTGNQPAVDIPALVAILTAVVLGGLTSLWLAAAGAVVVAVMTQGLAYAYNDVIIGAVLVATIIGVLLAQNARRSRADNAPHPWRPAREVRPVPAELRSLRVVRGWRWAGLAVVTAVVAGYPWYAPTSQTLIASTIVIDGIVGVSLLVLTGWSGQISLGQFGLAGVGAWAAASSHLPYVLAVPAGALAGAAVATLLGLPALRLRGLHLAVATLAFAAAVPTLLINPRYLGRWMDNPLRQPSIFGVSLDEPRTFYYFTLAVLALVVAAVVGLRRSRFARSLVAARDNERAAQSFGINLTQARLTAFAVSGFIAALAGAIFAFQIHRVSQISFSADKSITVFVMAVIGGVGTVVGPLIGALYVGSLNLAAASPVVTFLVTGGGGLAILLCLPGGLSQLLFALRDTALRRLAERRGIDVPSLMGEGTVAGRRAALAPIRRADEAQAVVTPRFRRDERWISEQTSADARQEETVGG